MNKPIDIEQYLKKEQIPLNELISLVYLVEQTQDTNLTIKTYKIIRKSYLNTFKRINESEIIEQEILKKLYETINNTLENINTKKLVKEKRNG